MPHQLATSSQRIAAHPHHSAWVAASAGSGKTKVLTDRVLNLLLGGCPPERILCLTFTKAAAAEMANRVRARLGEWAILSEKDLSLSLETLQGYAPTSEKIKRARYLFSLILDTPGGLKIQTTHSFCQALLKRFPLEAGLSPFFEIADATEQANIRNKASQTVMETAQDLILRFSEDALEELTHFVLENRSSFHALSSQKIEEKLGVAKLTKNELLKTFLNGIPQEALKKELVGFSEGSPTDQERGEILSYFLNLSDDEKIQKHETYLSIFLTQQERRALAF